MVTLVVAVAKVGVMSGGNDCSGEEKEERCFMRS